MTDQRDDQTDPGNGDPPPSDKPEPGDLTPAKVPFKYPDKVKSTNPVPYASPATATAADPGFFHIYKKGQGKWTRVGTVMAAALLGGMTTNFIWDETSYLKIKNFQLGYLPCFVFAAVYVLVAFLLMNKPRNVDFLIATDSEMKKVNWTSGTELWGSTKVIILFMFVIAVFLFLVDEFFEAFFYWIHVLKIRPW